MTDQNDGSKPKPDMVHLLYRVEGLLALDKLVPFFNAAAHDMQRESAITQAVLDQLPIASDGEILDATKPGADLREEIRRVHHFLIELVGKVRKFHDALDSRRCAITGEPPVLPPKPKPEENN